MAYYYSLLFRKRLHSLLLFFLLPSLHTLAEQDTGKITLNENNVQLETLIRKIENQTGLSFTYATRAIDGKSVIPAIRLNRVSLDEVLGTLFKGKNITWKVSGKTVILLPGTPSANDKTPESKADTIPQVTIKGTVTAEEGFPLPGATVLVKGTDRGTTTDNQGRFSLTGIPARSVVEVRYTGYAAQEFNVRESETLVAKLKRAVGALDEQVVIAYGTSSRRLLTGSIGKIRGTEIEKQPVFNPLAALQAKVPGLIISQQTGVPGGGFRVSIRGTNSLRNAVGDYQTGTNGNEPLYIVDGIPFFSTPQTMYQVTSSGSIFPFGTGANPLNSISPADIESVEILKDADATAIYGSRGANGVILITTKKGRTGRTKVDLNVLRGFGQVTRRMALLNTEEYQIMRREGFKNDGIASLPANAYDVNGTWSQNRYTDWQKELIGGIAHSTNSNITLSGGTLYTQYRVGVGYQKETTVFPGDFSSKRISSAISLTNTSPNGRFKSSISINYSFVGSDLPSQDLTDRARKLAPNAPALYDETGKLNFEKGTWQNPLAYTRQPYNSKTNSLISNTTISYEITNGLTLKTTLGYTNTGSKQVLKIPISSLDPNLPAGAKINSASFQSSENSSWNVEPQITYDKRIGNHHTINMLVGSAFQSETNESLNQNATGFLSESLMDNLSAVPAANIFTMYGNSLYRYNAIFGRISYNYKKKYLLNVNGRRDGSSRFGPGKQFANFGSIAGAWIFTEEDFTKRLVPFITFGKLRASYGTAGSDQIPNYGFQDTYTTNNAGQYQNMVGLIPTQLVNPDFSWELTKKLEGALELGVFQNRINISLAAFRNISTNQLVGYPLPSNTGFSTVQYNLAAVVENKGIEIELNSTNIKTENIEWQTSINLTLPKNKLTKFPNLETSPYSLQYVIGEPLAIYKVYKYVGIDNQTGLHQVVDTDKNGIYNSIDAIVNKFYGQKFYGGVSNSISFKGIQLEFIFQFVKQNALNYILNFSAMPGEMSNFPKEVMDRWQSPGDIKKIQKFSSGASIIPYVNFLLSDAAISDASFIRLKNLSLSYNLPLKFYKISSGTNPNVRIFAQAQNLITITKYRGLDPETQGNILPPLQMISFGFSLNL